MYSIFKYYCKREKNVIIIIIIIRNYIIHRLRCEKLHWFSFSKFHVYIFPVRHWFSKYYWIPHIHSCCPNFYFVCLYSKLNSITNRMCVVAYQVTMYQSQYYSRLNVRDLYCELFTPYIFTICNSGLWSSQIMFIINRGSKYLTKGRSAIKKIH